ncbi:amidase signature domain-containing protein [Dactylonectria macrodidyma]|uniref:Amidase signature domain-containing protein n=1 Tax=Dactylonectria macrodidyma TaxID=307937 RepID=A0A9P9IQY7_9HYPO|nr:amidase signature domain-containing protein [Dactylonectria macrodidyma]
MATLNIVEATIDDLQAALSQGALTSVELVAQYLRRISLYDCRGIALNSIPVLNNHLFEEAAASDDYRASGKPVRKLEGIPYTVKDSFKVKGMIAASGSPAFKDLVATDDAFTVRAIRNEGGVLIGRTNMPPMACGGMQRGIYGRAESPYNPEYLAAAFASGSSNGSAVSTAASLGAFGMGEETVSSGRSPASNNAVVAYTPSRGWISIRGNWPLYPTCDVVVPHTRTMKDMLALLEVLVAEDPSTKGDFWRDQPFVELPKPWGGSASPATFQQIAGSTTLQNLRFAVPAMYIGGSPPEGVTPVTVSPGVIRAWEEAKRQLESLGAKIVVVPDFPVVTAYENPDLLPKDATRLPENWHKAERGPMVAHGWDIFLCANADPNIPNLAAVDEWNIYPQSMRTPAEMEHLPIQNTIHWGELHKCLGDTTIYEVEGLKVALVALEDLRRRLLDNYLTQFNCNGFVFPAAGDVGAADAEVDYSSAAHAWKNGVFLSNGNRALRHLGVPSVTVPMGMIANKQMPVGLTFAGRAYDDENLLRWANAFEKKTNLRASPLRTPPLQTDTIVLRSNDSARASRPLLEVYECTASPANESDFLHLNITGILNTGPNDKEQVLEMDPVIQITVNGEDIPQEQISIGYAKGDTVWDKPIRFSSQITIPKPLERDEREKTRAPVARDKTMVVVLARSAPNGYPAGFLSLV